MGGSLEARTRFGPILEMIGRAGGDGKAEVRSKKSEVRSKKAEVKSLKSVSPQISQIRADSAAASELRPGRAGRKAARAEPWRAPAREKSSWRESRAAAP
jgi:hypothetical protein